MHTNNVKLNKNQIISLVALAEGIKQVRPNSGPADLLDLAARLRDLARAVDDRNTIEVRINGMHFGYDNATSLVNKAAWKVEAEAQRLVSSTLHLVEDLFGGHAAGALVIGGIPDGADLTNEGGDQEVFDLRAAHMDGTAFLDGTAFFRQPTGLMAEVRHRVPTGIKKRYGK
jgi:hypothetical protein